MILKRTLVTLSRNFVALIVLVITSIGASPASADLCQDFFDTRVDAGLQHNEFGIFFFHTGAGRNVLATSRLMGSMTEQGVTYLTVTAHGGGMRHFDSRLVFAGIDPVRARALVLDPSDTFKRTEERLVTLIGQRAGATTGRDQPEYLARTGDGKLVKVVRVLEKPNQAAE